MECKQNHDENNELDDDLNDSDNEQDTKSSESSEQDMKDSSPDLEMEAPSPKAVALRDGYNQTYMIKSSSNNIHEILFRCGNWCYTGKVDLGGPDLALADLPLIIPALQKQQGSLQFMCEWKKMSGSSEYAKPLDTLYGAFDFIGEELAGNEVADALEKATSVFSWIDDNDAKNYFELQTSGQECFDKYDIIASKTFIRGLCLIVIYYQRSYFVVLQEGGGEQPLLDVRFPDLSDHLQGIQIQKYDGRQNRHDEDVYEKLLLWQAVNESAKSVPPARALKVECKNVSGDGYAQTFLIRKTHPGADNNLREVLFRFGNWCYNGHVDLGPKLDLQDIPVIIPMLRRQQSALTFMCESSKMPSTSLFAVPMMHLATVIPALQIELVQAGQTLCQMAEDGHVKGIGDITSWLEDEAAECFFQILTDPCAQLADVEAIASKIYLGGVTLIILYYNHAFYVVIQDGNNQEQPLLDTRFPDVTCPSQGFQVATFRKGVEDFKELRRISLWKAGSEQQDASVTGADGEVARLISEKEKLRTMTKNQKDLEKAESKKESPSEVIVDDEKPTNIDIKSTSTSIKLAKASSNSDEMKDGGGLHVRKISSRPHHIAPLKGAGLADLKGRLKPLGGNLDQTAPWDSTGKPLGVLGSRK